MSSAPRIVDCMKKNVISVSASASIGESAALLARHHFGSLPLVE